MSKTAAMFGAAGALLLAIVALTVTPFFFHEPFSADLLDDGKEKEVIQKLVEEKQYELAAQKAIQLSSEKELSFFTREAIRKILQEYPPSRKDFEENQTRLLRKLKTLKEPKGMNARVTLSLLKNNFLDMEEILGKTKKETAAAIFELCRSNPDVFMKSSRGLWQRVVDAEEYDMARKLMNDGDYTAFTPKVFQSLSARTLQSKTAVIQEFSEDINRIIKVALHFKNDRAAAEVYKIACDFLTENECPAKYLEKPATVPDAIE